MYNVFKILYLTKHGTRQPSVNPIEKQSFIVNPFHQYQSSYIPTILKILTDGWKEHCINKQVSSTSLSYLKKKISIKNIQELHVCRITNNIINLKVRKYNCGVGELWNTFYLIFLYLCYKRNNVRFSKTIFYVTTTIWHCEVE